MADETLITYDNLRKYHTNLLDLIPANQIWRGNGTPPTGTEHIIAIDYSKGLMYFKNELGGWTLLSGGGGGSSSVSKLNISIVDGQQAKTISYGAKCFIRINWNSVIGEEPVVGDGIVKVFVNGNLKSSRQYSQGEIDISVGEYLVLGENTVEVRITDIYGTTEPRIFSVYTLAVGISSYFGTEEDSSAYIPHKGDIEFNYIPDGYGITKTTHFLIDGIEVATQKTTAHITNETFYVPKQSHGSHTLEVYWDGYVNEQDEQNKQYVRTDSLFYDIICVEEGNTTPIIACPFNTKTAEGEMITVKQFKTLEIPWLVYSPLVTNVDMVIEDNLNFKQELFGVGRGLQRLTYKAEDTGVTTITFSTAGGKPKTITFKTVENPINVVAATNKLDLHLTAKNRSNDVENPWVWRYNDIEAEMTGFNKAFNGWQTVDGDAVLRVSGSAKVEIDYKIFAKDFKTNGKTIEFEFATRDVLNPNTEIITCWDDGIGLKITAQEALLKSQQNEVSRQYKENEHIRVTFVITKSEENRLISLYINGVESKSVQYVSGNGGDSFSQRSPVGISIGSEYCTTDIYCIRVYDTALNRYQVLNNWIADTQDVEELLRRAENNDVFNSSNEIDKSKVDALGIPYLIITKIKREGENYEYVTDYSKLPQAKRKEGEKKYIVSGEYVDPLHPERSFTFENAEIDVQGTSSQFYPRKNYKIKFKGGFVVNKVHKTKYALREETSVPTDVFTFKTDYASSEGANNVELAMLYDEVNPARTPPQRVEGSKVRQGIEGYPCLMFYYDGSNHRFIGKYNFNNDKGTSEVFGFEYGSGAESWEILNNNDLTGKGAWKDDDYSDGKWKDTFEARYPEDNETVTNLQRFASWLKSTDTTAVDTEEEKQARITKFRNEFADYADVRAMLFNYVFTEAFLMVDNRRKNAFPTMYYDDGVWIILPYDFDTAIGINNNGNLRFGYWLEDIDYVDGSPVFNGQDSVLYVNMRLAFPEEIKGMYQEIRGHKAFNYEAIEKRFAEHQSVWGEAIFNEDSRFKYTEPLINDKINNLSMLQGSKASQRQWWLYNRFRYLDSKYNTGDSALDYISFYASVKEDIEITPYADIYAAAKFDSEYRSVRALRGEGDTPATYTIENPLKGESGGESASDQVTAIYSASQLASIGDLSKHKIGYGNFSAGTKLNYLKIGDSKLDENGVETYKNEHLYSLEVGALNLLTGLDIRNCTEFSQPVNVSECKNIREILCEGTKVTAVILPKGGAVETLHLPETVTNLTIIDHPSLKDFKIENNNFTNIGQLRLEGVDYNKVDVDFVEILNEIKTNSLVRVIGFDMTIDNATDILELYNKFDSFRGLDESGRELDNAKESIKGTIHCGTITSAELLEMQTRYPNITIDYKNIVKSKYIVTFINGGVEHSKSSYLEGDKIALPEAPTQESTEQYDFSFKGWSLDGLNVVDVAETVGNENITYYAVYDSILRYYTINFRDYDGKLLQSSLVAYGTTPFCESPTREETAQYFYDFDGWSPKVETVTSEATYIATYLQTLRTYTVKWLNEDESSLLEEDVNVPYGTMPSYDGAIPTKAGNAQYTYIFAGWHIDISPVKGDITYIATYTREVNEYTVTWKNFDGSVLETDEKVPYGDMPEYNGSEPSKPSTEQHSYQFLGWDANVTEEVETEPSIVTGNVVYTAIYTQHIRTYPITFKDEDGTVISTQFVEYGSMPTAPTPTREGYDFTGWDKSIVAVTGEATYTAQYSIKYFTITWTVAGKTIRNDTLAYGSTPTPPYAVGENVEIDGVVCKIKSYPSIEKVTGNATYNATAVIIKNATDTIVVRPTVCELAVYNNTAHKDTFAEAFVNGTGEWEQSNTSSKTDVAFVSGFDLNTINQKSNVRVTDVKFECTHSIWGNPTYATFAKKYKILASFMTDFSASNNSYVDLGDGEFTLINNSSHTIQDENYRTTETPSAPNALSWINSNLSKLVSGNFGVRLNVQYARINNPKLTLTYEYEYEEEV